MKKLICIEDVRWLIQETIRECLAELSAGRNRSLRRSPEVEPEPILVDSVNAARMLGISERTLWELKRRGELPHVAIGNGTEKESIRYAVSDLYALVAKRKACPKGSATIANAGGQTVQAD